MKNILVGVSWPYSNGPLHIGHLAGQYIVADVFARYNRMIGNKVLMVSGSDMHGTPITVNAEKKNIPVVEFVEQNHAAFLEVFKKLDIAFDLFTNTHTENHKIVVQNLIEVLDQQGFLLRQDVEQFYDEKAGRFLVDRYIEGTCPHCGYSPARGDQCDNCGHVLTPEELIDPKSKLTGETPIRKHSEHLFFDLSKFQKQLEQYIDTKEFWRKNTVEFSKAWLKEGLRPRAMSRDLDWGVPIHIQGFEDKVVYVWFEAVVGYLSAAIEWANNKNEPSSWEEFWKSAESEHYYFIAKDNIPFHSLFWPAQLLAYNEKYKSGALQNALPGETQNSPLLLPHNVVANMFLNIRGEKMSKSKGTFITADELLESYPKELIRYFFVRYAPENHDIDFMWEDIKTLNNNELVATFGNFIYRVMSYYDKRFGSEIVQNPVEDSIKDAVQKAFEEVGTSLSNTEFTNAINRVLALAQFGNQYLNEKEPWKIKDDTEALTVMTNALYIVYNLATLIAPFIPSTSDSLNSMFEKKGISTEWQAQDLPIGRIENIKPLIQKIEDTEAKE